MQGNISVPCLKSKFRDEKHDGGVRECCVFHRFFSQSFVSCQALAEALNQNSALPHLKLFNENIGPEGAKAWCLVRMVS